MGSIKCKLRKTGNEDICDIVWEQFVKCKGYKIVNIWSSDIGTCKEVAEKVGKSEFREPSGCLESSRNTHWIVLIELYGEIEGIYGETNRLGCQLLCLFL